MSVEVPNRTSIGYTELRQKAIDTFGPLKADADSGKVKKALKDGNLSLQDLSQLWDMPTSFIKGLEKIGIVWVDGIDEAELGQIEVAKKEARANFGLIFKGSPLSKNEIDEMFDDMWEAAAKGELDNGKWDDIVKAYGLKDWVMTRPAFKALMSGQDDFAKSALVEGIAEFCIAISNLIYTCKAKAQGSENSYAIVLRALCKHRSFRIVYGDKAEALFMDSLKKINPEYDFESKTTADICKDIKEGEFGDRLEQLASYYKINDWEEMVLRFLQIMEKAVARNSDDQYETELQATLATQKKMDAVYQVMDEGVASFNYDRLIDECAAFLNEEKDYIADITKPIEKTVVEEEG